MVVLWLKDIVGATLVFDLFLVILSVIVNTLLERILTSAYVEWIEIIQDEFWKAFTEWSKAWKTECMCNWHTIAAMVWLAQDLLLAHVSSPVNQQASSPYGTIISCIEVFVRTPYSYQGILFLLYGILFLSALSHFNHSLHSVCHTWAYNIFKFTFKDILCTQIV